MKVSKRCEYALRALINLGIAAEVGRSLVQIAELADHEQIPVKFLEQIMKDLKAHGYVASARGKFGGYRLKRPAAAIPIGEIVRLLDGPLAPIGCVSQTAYEKCSCPDETHCGLRMIMLDVRNAIAAIVDRYTVADLVAVTLRKMRASGVAHPFSESSTPQPGATRRHRPRPQPSALAAATLAEGILSSLIPEYSI
jgi:Rrf2 family protein